MRKAMRRFLEARAARSGAVGRSANVVGAGRHQVPLGLRCAPASFHVALAIAWTGGMGLGCADVRVFADTGPALDARQLPPNPGTTTQGGGGAGGSTPGVPETQCATSSGCDQCQEGAEADGGPCAAEWTQCSAAAECQALWNCLATCQDAGCADACYDEHPAGMTDYSSLYLCVLCDVCATKCDVAGSCG
jgi:hypothetical protein